MLWNLVYPIRHWYDESYHWPSLIIVRPDNNSLELVSAYSATATDVDPPVNDTTVHYGCFLRSLYKSEITEKYNGMESP